MGLGLCVNGRVCPLTSSVCQTAIVTHRAKVLKHKHSHCRHDQQHHKHHHPDVGTEGLWKREGNREGGCEKTEKGSSLKQMKVNYNITPPSSPPPPLRYQHAYLYSDAMCFVLVTFMDFVWVSVNTNKHLWRETLRRRHVFQLLCSLYRILWSVTNTIVL